MTNIEPILEVIDADEIVRRRRDLVQSAGMSHTELVVLDAAGAADQEQQSILRRIQQLDYLMSDETDRHYAAVARVNALYDDAMLDTNIYGCSDDLEMFLVALRDAIGEDLHEKHTRAAARAEAAHRTETQ